MIALTHKSKQYGWFALKLFILGAAFFYIYKKMVSGHRYAFDLVLESIENHTLSYVLFFLLLATINWMLESMKWQELVCLIESISFLEALQQTLASLTISLPTPSRLGEYGAKAFFFQKNLRKKVVFLTFLGNSAQMITTIGFGLVGLWLLSQKLDISFSWQAFIGFLVIVLLLIIVAYYFRNKELFIKGFSLRKASRFIKDVPLHISLKLMGYSLLRYAVFSTLFYLCLQFFGAETSLWETLAYIYVMYLFTSLLPVFLFWDVVVKGSIALWLFSFLGVPEETVIATVLSMWILNFAIPALAGSYFVLKLQPK